MDKSEMRRGQACWYKRPGVGLTAINDSLMLESAVYELLKIHCADKPYYLKCLQLFLDVSTADKTRHMRAVPRCAAFLSYWC